MPKVATNDGTRIGYEDWGTRDVLEFVRSKR